MLSRFNIITSIDKDYGISKTDALSGKSILPFTSASDMKFFRETTIGNDPKGCQNVVIMGRLTYESIGNPLEKRTNIIVSRTMRQQEHPNLVICSSIISALETAHSILKGDASVFVIGGESIYNEVIRKYLYLVDKIYVTKFKNSYNCSQFFKYDDIKDYPFAVQPYLTNEYTRYVYNLKGNVPHEETKYLSLLKEILDTGSTRPDRTGTGVKGVFGRCLEYNIENSIPLFTTKKVNYDAIIKELLFFISGSTDASILSKDNVKIWDANTSKKALEERDLPYDEFDMGPMYGFQWRHAGEKYVDCHTEYKGIDQIKNVIDGIKSDPFGRRHIVSSWSVPDIKDMALPPCHDFFQFYVSSDKKHIDCLFYQRSCDMFLGVPFNICSYAILTYMIGHLTNLKPKRLIHSMGDCHIYDSHISAVKKQLSRTPRPAPTLRFRGLSKIHTIDDFKIENIIVEDYESCPFIAADMAV